MKFEIGNACKKMGNGCVAKKEILPVNAVALDSLM